MGRGVDICKNPNFVEFYVLLELKVVTTQVMTLKVLVRHSDAAAGDGNESNGVGSDNDAGDGVESDYDEGDDEACAALR